MICTRSKIRREFCEQSTKMPEFIIKIMKINVCTFRCMIREQNCVFFVDRNGNYYFHFFFKFLLHFSIISKWDQKVWVLKKEKNKEKLNCFFESLVKTLNVEKNGLINMSLLALFDATLAFISLHDFLIVAKKLLRYAGRKYSVTYILDYVWSMITMKTV